MSTTFEFSDSGELIGTRFSAGLSGTKFQFDFSEEEWLECMEFGPVAGDDGSTFATVDEFVRTVVNSSQVMWDNPTRQNEMARELENHRFVKDGSMKEPLLTAARINRERAVHLTKRSLHVT
jgi:hypothetical protein